MLAAPTNFREPPVTMPIAQALADHASTQIVPALAIVAVTLVFFALERRFSGRTLPTSPGWLARALAMNLIQLGLIGLGGLTWNRAFRGHSLFHLAPTLPAIAQGALFWFAGTFVFYWWHRLRHADGFWRVLHQLHHSPSRIELLTSFYKHPVEMVADSVITGALVYCVCGGSAEAGAWTSFFGAAGEYFYHSNIRTPRWVGWFLQRPEHHSIHHAVDVHRYNYGDITWWDRLFGTFIESDGFAAECGFTDEREQRWRDMLLFRDVHAAPRAR